MEAPFYYINTGIFKATIYECVPDSVAELGGMINERNELACIKGFAASAQARNLVALMNEHYNDPQFNGNPCPYSIEDIGYTQLFLRAGKRIQAPITGISSSDLAALLNHACATGVASRLSPTI